VQGSLARKLRIIRVEHGLTQRQAANQAGVTPATISELERGVRRPHDITLSKLAKGYGVPIEDLLELS
jgi:transcriptional regulator with XRE-family HTH domain